MTLGTRLGSFSRAVTSRRTATTALPVVMAACWLVLGASASLAQVEAKYLYSLSSFSGQLPYEWPRVYVDQERDETYVVYQNLVHVFNGSGMETFSFGDDLSLGQLLDITVDQRGDILLLSRKDSASIVTRCDFRGVPRGPFEVKNLPPGLPFSANRMLYRNGFYYFVSLDAARVLVADADGEYRKDIEFMPKLALDEKQRDGAQMFGFTVDQDGNMFFTVPTAFKVFKYSPDGTLTSFGKSGSPPGSFGIVAGVVTDAQGNVLVTDRLKSVVMVFDRNFNFLTEFGRRGFKPGNLIAPDDVAVDNRGRVYVTQARKRGVSVFALTTS